MKKKDLERITSLTDTQIEYCKVLYVNENSITFEVDENLEIGEDDLMSYKGTSVIGNLLNAEQIEDSLDNIIASSFMEKDIIDVGSDVLYKTIITCYGQHHPLVLSPDMIWLLIVQTLSKHINENAEKYRKEIVSHAGEKDIIIESAEDLLCENTDWSVILDGFFDKIEENTKDGMVANIVADFSTTGVNDRIALVATLMHGVQSYFRYTVCHNICGIPFIILKGSKDDWKSVLQKSSILKKFSLDTWYIWLKPILIEFIKAAEGKANRLFWKNMVRKKIPVSCPAGSGCAPDYVPIDGWCTALFPYKNDSGRFVYNRSLSIQRMASETIRVGFQYVRIYPNGRKKTYPMELWAGMVGVEEDAKTHSLTPLIGWFVRKSDEEKESLDRLKGADKRSGIELRIDTVPEILNKLESINSLRLLFTGKVNVPNWLYNKKIDNLEVFGEIDADCESRLKQVFPNVKINEEQIMLY